MKAGPFKSHSEVIIGCMIYGTFGIFLDHIREMSAGSILFYRLLFGLCVLLLYLSLSRGLGQLRPGKYRKYLVLLAVLNAFTGFAYFTAIQLSGMSVAVLLLYTAPVYVNFLAPHVLGEKSSSKNPLPLILALVGVVLVARPENLIEGLGSGLGPERDTSSFLGLAAGLLSGLSFSGVILTIRYLKDDYTGLAKTFWLTGLGLILTFPFAFFTPLPVLFENLSVLFLLGLTATFAILLHLKGFSGLRARPGSILALLEPVFGIFFDYTILKNPLYTGTVLGCVFILAAAVLVSFERPFRRGNSSGKEE